MRRVSKLGWAGLVARSEPDVGEGHSEGRRARLKGGAVGVGDRIVQSSAPCLCAMVIDEPPEPVMGLDWGIRDSRSGIREFVIRA